MRILVGRGTALLFLVGILLIAGCVSLREDEVPDAESRDKGVAHEATAETSAEQLLSSVYDAVNDGDIASALDTVASYRGPLDEDILLLHGRLLMAEGRFDAAADVLRDAAEARVEARIMLAQLEDDPRSRLAAWEYARELAPNHPDVRAGIGHSLLEKGNLSEAESEFEAVLAAKPGHVNSLVGMSEVAGLQGQHEERVGRLEDAIEHDPAAGHLYARLGHALVETGEANRALEAFTTAIEREPEHAWHYFDRGRIYQRNDEQENALEDFNAAISRERDIFLFYFHRASSRYELQRYGDALSDYEAVVRLEPDYSDAWPPLGALLFRFGRYEEAAHYFARSYGRISSDPSFLMLAGLSWREGNMSKRADAFFAEVERSASRDSLYYDMAREYQNPRRDNRTEGRIRRESDRNMQTRMRFYLGALYFSQGRTRAAEYLFLQVRDAGSTGYVESELAEVYLERIQEQRSAE